MFRDIELGRRLVNGREKNPLMKGTASDSIIRSVKKTQVTRLDYAKRNTPGWSSA